jgi:TPR repeat protein
MGRIYEEGRYLNKDLNFALNYFLESKKNGFIESEEDIIRIKKKLGSS